MIEQLHQRLYTFKVADEIKKAEMYPYFRALSSAQNTTITYQGRWKATEHETVYQ